jgi:hypothetical protein
MRKSNPNSGPTPIKNLFAVYSRRLAPPPKIVIQAFISTCAEYHLPITPNQCTYQPHSRTLQVRAFGPIKSTLTLKEKEIIAVLKDTLGDRYYPLKIL